VVVEREGEGGRSEPPYPVRVRGMPADRPQT
jgi:hypothetical protein